MSPSRRRRPVEAGGASVHRAAWSIAVTVAACAGPATPPPRAEGALPARAVDVVVERYAEEINLCLLAAEVDALGAAWTVTPQGTVGAVRLAADTPPFLAQCVTAMLRAWELVPPVGGPVEVERTLRATASSGTGIGAGGDGLGGVLAAGKAFDALDRQLEIFRHLRLTAPPDAATLAAFLAFKERALRHLEGRYLAMARHEAAPPPVRIGALVRAGELFEELAASINAVPAPEALQADEDARRAHYERLLQRALPVEEMALFYFEHAVRTSQQRELVSAWLFIALEHYYHYRPRSPFLRELLRPGIAETIGAEKPRVLVQNLRADGAHAELAATLTAMVTHALAAQSDGRSSVLQLQDFESVLALQSQKQELGCDDEACIAELSGALGVQRLVGGSVGTLGEGLVLHLQLIQTTPFEVLARAQVQGTDGAALAAGVAGACEELLGD